MIVMLSSTPKPFWFLGVYQKIVLKSITHLSNLQAFTCFFFDFPAPFVPLKSCTKFDVSIFVINGL